MRKLANTLFLIFLGTALLTSLLLRPTAADADPENRQNPDLARVEQVLRVMEQGTYNPQVDLDNNGKIDLKDLDLAVKAYERKVQSENDPVSDDKGDKK